MLKLKYENECWRECLLNEIDKAEADFGVCLPVDAYDDAADELCRGVLEKLADAGVDYERAYQQSVGAFVIVQGGTDEERETFNVAFDEVFPDAVGAVRKIAEAEAHADD